MKRAAFLGTCSIPFHLRYWMEFLPNWIDEVDEIVISLQQMSDSNRKYATKILSENKKIKVIPNPQSPWPQDISDSIIASDSDSILILHDDTFILKKGVVDKLFTIAEKGNVVTATHSIYSPADYVDRTLKEMYGDYLKDFKEYSFLLYFLFMPRKFFMATSRYLGGVGWKKGEWVEWLGRHLEQDVAGDTGFQLGLELFMNKAPFDLIPRQTTAHLQFELDPLKAFKETTFPAGWVHFQNMANTLPEWFDGTHGWRNIAQKEDPVMQAFMCIRLALMQEFLDVDKYEEIQDYTFSAEIEMLDIRDFFKLDQHRIDEYQKEIRRILCVAS